MRQIRCHFRQDRQPGTFPHCCGVCPNQLRILPHIGAKPVAAHLGTGKVAFDDIRPRLLRAPCKLRPFRLVPAHNGGNDDLFRECLLQSPQGLEVFFRIMIRNLLQVPESHKGSILLADGIEPRRNLLGDEQTDGFEHHPCPAHGQRPCAHVIAACHHRGGQEKWIFTGNAKKICRQPVQIRLGTPLWQGCRRLPDPQRKIIMPTRLFAGTIAGSTSCPIHLPGSPGRIPEPNRPEHTRRVIALGTSGGTSSVPAQQASCRLIADIQHGAPLLSV